MGSSPQHLSPLTTGRNYNNRCRRHTKSSASRYYTRRIANNRVRCQARKTRARSSTDWITQVAVKKEAVTAMRPSVTCKRSTPFKLWGSQARTRTYQPIRRAKVEKSLVTSAFSTRRSSLWQTLIKARHRTWWPASSTYLLPSSSHLIQSSSMLRAEPAPPLKCIIMTIRTSNTIPFSLIVMRRGKLLGLRKIIRVTKEATVSHKNTSRRKLPQWARVLRVLRTIKPLKQQIWWTTPPTMGAQITCRTAYLRKRFVR